MDTISLFPLVIAVLGLAILLKESLPTWCLIGVAASIAAMSIVPFGTLFGAVWLLSAPVYFLSYYRPSFYYRAVTVVG